MKTTIVMLRMLQRIGDISAELEREPEQRSYLMTTLIDEVMGYIALEDHLFLPMIEAARPAAVPELRAMHERAKTLLFRLSTRLGSATFRAEIVELRRLFRGHALELSSVLPIVHDEPFNDAADVPSGVRPVANARNASDRRPNGELAPLAVARRPSVARTAQRSR